MYGVWIAVVFALTPVCRWFAALKQRRSDWWLSYLYTQRSAGLSRPRAGSAREARRSRGGDPVEFTSTGRGGTPRVKG